MTPLWILYVWLLSAAAGAAALTLELALHRHRLQTRWVWLAAGLVASAATVAPFIPVTDELVTAAQGPRVTAAADFPPALLVEVDEEVRAAPAGSAGIWLRRPLPYGAAAWGALSFLTLLLLAGAELRQARRRRRWTSARAGGTTVLRSPDTGPAAAGILRGAIVLPERAFERLDAASLELVVEHEAEHLRGGDVRLLAVFGAVLALAPWNLPLWWCGRRLAAAIEMDCDQRLLRRGSDPARYARLLLEVAGWGTVAPLHGPALGRPVLRRRLEQIVGARPGRAPTLIAAGVATAGLAAALACDVSNVTGSEGVAEATSSRLASADVHLAVPGDLRRAVARAARSDAAVLAEGVVALRLYRDADGSVIQVGLDATSGPHMTPAAVSMAIDVWRDVRLTPTGAGRDGWVPAWVRFQPHAVEAFLVYPALYVERGFETDREALVRHMEVLDQLPRSAGLFHTLTAADTRPTGAQPRIGVVNMAGAPGPNGPRVEGVRP